MIIIMKRNASPEAVNHVSDIIRSKGLEVHLSQGQEVTIIGVVGDKSRLADQNLEIAPGVDRIVPVTESYKLANKKFHPQPSVIPVGNTEIGPNTLTVMAGPCAVESEEQLLLIAREVKKGRRYVCPRRSLQAQNLPVFFPGS